MKLADATLNQTLQFYNGKATDTHESGIFTIYGSNGTIGFSNEFNHEAAIVLGRVGAYCGSAKISDDKFWASDNTIVVKPKPGHSLHYWYYLLKTLSLRSYAGGAAQPLLTHGILSNVKTKYHSDFHQQVAIASILSAYDDLIENNNRVDGVPEGWEKKELADLCESIDYGYTASAELEEVGPKFLRITDIVPSFIDWASVPFCTIKDDRLEKFRLCEGDIVIARTGATVGYAKRMHKRHPCAVFASYLVRLRLKSNVDSCMVGIYVESQDYKNYVRSRIGGAAQPNANAKVLTGAKFLVPTSLLQRAFRDIVEPLNDQREILQLQNQKLKAARDLLLPKLMSGEIAV